MIRQLLITLFVIAVVVIFYRVKNAHKNRQAEQSSRDANNPSDSQEKSYNPMLLAYGVVGFVILFSSLVWVLGMFENNEVITVRVINANQSVTTYQVKRKDYQDRKFTTTDNIRIRLSDNDRVEIIEP